MGKAIETCQNCDANVVPDGRIENRRSPGVSADPMGSFSPRAVTRSPAQLGTERGPVEAEQLRRCGAVAARGIDDLLHECVFDEVQQ